VSGRILSPSVLVSVMAIVAACSSSAPTIAQPTAGVVPAAPSVSASVSPTSSGIDSGLPDGTYAATIPSGVNAAPGVWKLTITASEVMFTHPEGHSFSPGFVEEITATEVVFAPDPACPAQEGTPTSGRYGWSAEGTSLIFEVISDSCHDRIDTLTPSAWSEIRS